MDAVIFRCAEGAQFRAGETSLADTSEVLHSDTLFSALAENYDRVYGGENLIVAGAQSGKFRFSSAFVVARERRTGERIFFVPKPPLHYKDSGESAKKLKRVKYVSLGVLRKITESLRRTNPVEETIPDSEYQLTNLPSFGGTHVFLPEELPEAIIGKTTDGAEFPALYVKMTIPKVKVHTPTDEDAFYHETICRFRTVRLRNNLEVSPHLYFWCHSALPESDFRKVTACLRIAADSGIGGSRSTGAGHFNDIEFKKDMPVSDNEGTWRLLLSLCIPSSKEEFQKCYNYKIVRRGGGSLGKWGEGERHRKSVLAVSEGALLKPPVYGTLADLSPEEGGLPHPILRNGFAFSIPIL